MKPPPKQTHYEDALIRGFEVMRAREGQDLATLGAREVRPGCWDLPVLDGVFRIDLDRSTIFPAQAEDREPEAAQVRIEWRILTLHYLAAQVPVAPVDSWISFADLPDGRGYDPVYRGRVVDRFCATAGRDRETFVQAGLRLGAERTDAGDEGFRFPIFPHLAMVILWYGGDEELGPGASFLYPDNVLSMLPVEDVVVLSESLISRLQGQPW